MIDYIVPNNHILIELQSPEELEAARSVIYSVIRNSKIEKIANPEDLTYEEKQNAPRAPRLKFDTIKYGAGKDKFFMEDRELTGATSVFIDNMESKKR